MLQIINNTVRVSNITLAVFYFIFLLLKLFIDKNIKPNIFFLLILPVYGIIFLIPREALPFCLILFYYLAGKVIMCKNYLRSSLRLVFGVFFCLIILGFLYMLGEIFPLSLELKGIGVLGILTPLLLSAPGRMRFTSKVIFFSIVDIIFLSMLLEGVSSYFLFVSNILSLLFLLCCGLILIFKEQFFLIPSYRSPEKRMQSDQPVQSRMVEHGILVTGIVHELKAVFFYLKSGLRFYKTNKKMKARALEMIEESANRGTDFLNRLLKPLHLEEVKVLNLAEEVDKYIGIISSTLRGDEGIVVRKEIPKELKIKISPGELEQIILNLINNAARALVGTNQTEKKILLRAGLEGGNLCLEVIDNGPGVKEDKEFTLFQAHVSGQGSSGLGLYIVESLVRKNRGTITYFPIQGGAKFQILFPLPEEEGAKIFCPGSGH